MDGRYGAGRGRWPGLERGLAGLIAGVCWASAAGGFEAGTLWTVWEEERFVEVAAPCLGPVDLEDHLRRLEKRHRGELTLQVAGRSARGRPIHLIVVGRGDRRVLLWSQMHGDEPSATPALLDLIDYLLRHAEEPAAEAILERLTLLVVPMLNPDGAAIYERRNAQWIDVNRDALALATPEGRLLATLRDRYGPMLAFNLHDQNRRTTVGDSGVLATNSVLAVAGDAAGTLTPGRRRAQRAASAIAAALAPFYPGGMARYDEDWNARAFGDNLTAWGTPVVLLESGGVPPSRPTSDLTRLNFVALAAVLADLAADDLAGHDPEVYEALPRNRSRGWTDVVVTGGRIRQPGAGAPYPADLAFDRLWDDRQRAGCGSTAPPPSQIREIGDARHLGRGEEVDAGGRLVVPPYAATVRGWPARRRLDARTLEELALAGYGTVRWVVPRHRVARAAARSVRLAGPGRAMLQVMAEPAPTVGRLLEVRRRGGPLEPRLTVGSPGGRGPHGPDGGPLRPGRPASFLLLAVDGAGGETLDEVWLDGQRVLEAD